MSSTNSPQELQYRLCSDDWDDLSRQLDQWESNRGRVSAALREANAAFAAQFTHPDGFKYMQDCDRFAQFLDLKIPLDDSEQKQVVQTLQIACAMHENAVKNDALTETQRLDHYLASISLASLCESALNSGVKNIEPWLDVHELSLIANQAFSRAWDILDLSKYLDFTNMTDDFFASESGNGTGFHKPSAAPSPVPATSPLSTQTPSAHDSIDTCQTPLPGKLDEKVEIILNGRASKGARLGRAQTMPVLRRALSKSFSSLAGPSSPKAQSRVPGLEPLEEEQKE